MSLMFILVEMFQFLTHSGSKTDIISDIFSTKFNIIK